MQSESSSAENPSQPKASGSAESSAQQSDTNPQDSMLSIGNIPDDDGVRGVGTQDSSSTHPSIGPTRVPGTYPPEWLNDSDTDSCMSCDSPFTLIKRRHHCRSCGKIFCSDCCSQKAKLLYLNNKEARVCVNCFRLIKFTLMNTQVEIDSPRSEPPSTSLTGASNSNQQTSTTTRVQGILKTRRPNESDSPSGSSDQQSIKQVIYADGIRPGTFLEESSPAPLSLLTRQSQDSDEHQPHQSSSTSTGKSRTYKNLGSGATVVVCDDKGYLPPIVVSENASLGTNHESSSSSSFTGLIASQLGISCSKKSPHDSMDSRACPLNGVMQFEEIAELTGLDGVVTFLLLKDYHLKVKLVKKNCCIATDKVDRQEESESCEQILQDGGSRFWSFASEGLSKFYQKEIVLIISRDKTDLCIPRDAFKCFLTLHELCLRRVCLESLGNLLFQDGLFGSRDTAGLLFVRPLDDHCFNELILPSSPYLIALVLQRWEVPWGKVFPVRLLLRLGYQLGCYPYPILSFTSRDPVYYEVGLSSHSTIASVLCDFRNFRYSLNHVDGLKVILDKGAKKVSVEIDYSCYDQFNKVLDSSLNEHVLAWSSGPFSEADGHLVSVQNEDGQHETVEFYKKKSFSHNVSFEDLKSSVVLGASFIIFSGALKVNQTSGQPAKIAVIEDGVLIQIPSSTMSALKEAIKTMKHFSIDSGSENEKYNRVDVDWKGAT